MGEVIEVVEIGIAFINNWQLQMILSFFFFFFFLGGGIAWSEGLGDRTLQKPPRLPFYFIHPPTTPLQFNVCLDTTLSPESWGNSR